MSTQIRKRRITDATGMCAMKTIKIVITDADGVLLDRCELEVASDCSQIAVRPIEGSKAERPDETLMFITSEGEDK